MIKHILKLIWNKKRSNSLMILEIFLSYLVLFFSLAYVFYNLSFTSKPLGFATEDRWIVHLDNIEGMDSLEALNTMQNLKRNLSELDEITGMTFTQSIYPFSGNQWRSGSDENGFNINALVAPADIEFGEIMDVNLIEGRWFEEADLTAAIPPIIVNKNFMDEYYPGKSMLDSTFVFTGEQRLVGVVDEYRYIGEFSEPEAQTFHLRPYTENMDNILLRIKPGVDASFEEKLSKVLTSTTKLTGNTIEKLEQMRKDDSRESWILMIAMLSICGFLCLNVALGLFGILWYNISKRKSEIGLRQALGAHGSDITKQFILEVLIITGIAVAIGAFFAVQIPILQVTEYPESLFYKAILYAAAIIFALVFICALFPSFQAARIRPATSLHED